MAKDKSAAKLAKAERKAEKKAKKAAKLEGAGVTKPKSDKKEKKEKRKVLAEKAVNEIEGKKSKKLKKEESEEDDEEEGEEEEEEVVKDEIMNGADDNDEEEETIKVETKGAVVASRPIGALVPFANPLADEKVAKKVFKCVKKGMPTFYPPQIIARHRLTPLQRPQTAPSSVV